MTSPVDYFARDTIKRVLGEKLLPSISRWKKIDSSYEYRYGSRLYTIQPDEDDFRVTVQPGVVFDKAWLTFAGWERGHPSGTKLSIRSLKEAVHAANEHAAAYDLLP